jgi:hypothetical protein
MLPSELEKVLKNGKSRIIIPKDREEIMNLAMGGAENMTYDVAYGINGKSVREVYMTRCKNGIVANFEDPAMRKRDGNAMVIGDEHPTDKPTYQERFGEKFDKTRTETFEWLASQEELVLMPFYAGNEHLDLGYPALVVCPANAAFFCAALADLQGYIPASKIPNKFKPRAIVYVAPPFRHTHFEGKQVVVHNRTFDMHEVFSYNLYLGPSAKKGIYAVLLDIGEQENWVTLHASAVKVITPYERVFTIMHEGASGGGKSEMLEPIHREPDGKVQLGTNIVSGEKFYVTINDTCELLPVTDDMAMAPKSIQNTSKKLVVADAEEGWFLRVNHITEYGTEPGTEKRTLHPKKPLVFLNMEATPGSTCLLWEPVMDAPGKPCSNPRVIMPRSFLDNVVNEPVEIDVRSFGVRTPPTTKDKPSYGIIGLFHILPPALGWIWRLVAPRGYANPSINDNSKMNEIQSEGVGSYWPFATGKKVDQANLLLKQIINTPNTAYVLIPNQYLGAYKVGFSAEMLTREYLSRRGGTKFREGTQVPARCSLLGYALDHMKINGTEIPRKFLQINAQPEVGNDTYDFGAKILTDFFKKELAEYLTDELDPLGRKIIEACLNDATVEEYEQLIAVK